MISSFSKIYDELAKQSKLVQPNSCWTVVENNPGASLKSADIHTSGLFKLAFNQNLLKGKPDWSTKISSAIAEKDCDGVAFAEDDGKLKVFLAELKSNFDTKKLFYAVTQLTNSFFKLIPFIHMCGGFDLNKSEVHFIVGCQTYKNEEQKDGVLDYLNQYEELLGKGPFFQLTKRFVLSGQTSCTIESNLKELCLGDAKGENYKSLTLIGSLPFNAAIKNMKVLLTMTTTSEYKAESLSVSV